MAGIDGGTDTGVGRRQEAQGCDLQHRGVQLAAAPGAGKAAERGIPGLGDNLIADTICGGAQLGLAGRLKARRHTRHTVRGSPAHEIGKGLRLPFRAVFPDAGVGRADHTGRFARETFKELQDSRRTLGGESLSIGETSAIFPLPENVR